MNLKTGRNFFFLLLLLASNQLFAQTVKYNRVEKLNDLFSYLYKNKMFNGGVAVKYKGKLIFKKGYGTGNFETGTSFTPASQTEIASVSKQFTASAIMMLRDEGKLKVSDNINKYFKPDLPFENITIKQLLSHRSGLPRYPPYFKKNWDYSKKVTNKDIMDWLRKDKPALLFASGTQYKYSNLGYMVLAQIVDHVSGMPLDEFLDSRIFKPFGMKSTGFFNRDSIFTMPDYAPGVIWDKEAGQYSRPERVKGKEFVWYLSGRLGSGRLTSTVNDLLIWDSLLYTNKVLPQKTLHEMFTPVSIIEKKPDSYGYGWRINKKDHSIVSHTGSWPGNLTYIKRYTNEKSTIIILNNTSSKYMASIRNAVDAIVEGRKAIYPKKKK